MVTPHYPAWSTVNIAGLGLEHIDEYFHFNNKLDKKAIEACYSYKECLILLI